MNNFTLFWICLFLFIRSSPGQEKSPEVVYLFAHGLTGNKNQAYAYTQKNRSIIDPQFPLVTFDFPDARGPLASLCRINFTQTSMAQDNEIRTLKNEYDRIVKKYPATSVILIGLSRGASTACNFVALHQPSQVKALVLESPYDSLSALIQDLLRNKWLRACALKLIRYGIPFFKYRPEGIHPIQVAHRIAHQIPILFICSDEDTTVPKASTIRLAWHLKMTGHSKSHLEMLCYGKHAHLLQGSDGARFQETVHAFYRYYGLPHDPVCAQECTHPDFLTM
jgi:pimeloyl-ACP methyl ester carboxylesterase